MIFKILPLFALTIFNSFLLRAQIADFDEKATEQDFVYNVNLYGNEYIAPVIDGYGLNLTSGWDNTAKPLKPWAVSAKVHMAASFTPKEDLTFNFNEVPFSDNFYLKDPSKPDLPTVLGGDTKKELVYRINGKLLGGPPVSYSDYFPALSGITSPFDATPSSSLVLGMGLPGDLEVSLRVFPWVKYFGVRHYQVGAGIKHMVSRYFLPEGSNFHFSLSAYYNLSRFSNDAEELIDGKNKKIIFVDHAVTAQGVLSYDVGPLSIFALGGYYYTNNSFKLNGTYSFEVRKGVLVQEAFVVTDPVDISRANGNVKFAGGITGTLLNRVFLSLSYHVAEYNTLSAEIGVLLNNGKSGD